MIALFRALFAPPRHLILILVALWVGVALTERHAEQYSISKDSLSNLVYYSLFAYLLGGRLLYALSNLSAFSRSPFSVFSLNLDLFDPWAGLAVSVIVGFVYGSRHKMQFWSVLDALTPLFGLLAVGISLSHLAAGTAFGSPTTLPWGMDLWGATRHPSQVYELLASLLIFFLLWFRATNSHPGSSFLLFVTLTAGTQLFLEAFRGDSTLIFGGFRLAQVAAWLVLAAALIANESIRKSGKLNKSNSPHS